MSNKTNPKKCLIVVATLFGLTAVGSAAESIWKKKADMITPRYAMGISVVDGTIYTIGGTIGPGNAGVSTLEVYDPAADTWTPKTDMPTPRTFLSACAANGKIYSLGGRFSHPGTLALSAVEEFDPFPLIIDFNGDGMVNFKDFSKLVQYGRQDESSADIPPGLYSEHAVDYEQLAVLAEHWLEDVGLIAHWKLDETEGRMAYDSIAGNDAFGPPDLLWRPEDGKVGGALELDGIDDLLFTTFSLNPADTSFSVFAWVKGGAPGQVIISQTGGANWLWANPADGTLMTELRGSRRFGGPSYSQTVITDGDWHRVGLTRDGSNRVLYVDDVEVARDTQAGLAGSNGGLYFGAGRNPVAPSLWLGLIDDIRIYDRAIVP